MSKTGGVYERISGDDRCQVEAVTSGGEVNSANMDGEFNDFADAMNEVFWRDGSAAATGNWDMNNYNLLNVGYINGVAPPITGTFTPDLADPADWTISTANGNYVKIGNIVFVFCNIVATRTATILANKQMEITGLPFLPNNNSGLTFSRYSGIETDGLVGHVTSGSTVVDVYQLATVNVPPVVHQEIFIDDLGTISISFSGMYQSL